VYDPPMTFTILSAGGLVTLGVPQNRQRNVVTLASTGKDLWACSSSEIFLKL
jgi:hypothetical protein